MAEKPETKPTPPEPDAGEQLTRDAVARRLRGKTVRVFKRDAAGQVMHVKKGDADTGQPEVIERAIGAADIVSFNVRGSTLVVLTCDGTRHELPA